MIKESRFPSATKTGDIFVRCWIPDDKPLRGVVQLTHGMAEHIERYNGFASFLNGQGYALIAHDQAGHGKSVDENGLEGYFGEASGWDKLIEDMHAVYELGRREFPNALYVLMGHSMGSFLARSYAARRGEDMDAFIFSGTAGKNPALPVAKLIVKSEIKKHGLKGSGEKLDKLAFGSYARAIPGARTAFDWLSRDKTVVDTYIRDPRCGFVFTLGGFRDLFDGLSEIQRKEWALSVPKKPILVFSGSCDPVGGKNARGPKEVAGALLNAGHDVVLKIYEGGRHEMLNEFEKDEVYADVLAFLEKLN